MIAPENKPLDVRVSNEGSVPSSDGNKMRAPPSERKDFNRIYEEKGDKKGGSKGRKTSVDKSEDTEVASAGEDSEDTGEKKLPPVSSLFSKSGKDTREGEDSESMPSEGKLAEQKVATSKKSTSPFSLFQQQSTAKKNPAWEAMAQEGTDLPVFATGDNSLTKPKTTTRFDPEQPEMTHVNLMSGGPMPLAASVGEEPPKVQGTIIGQLKEIVDKLVDKLYTMETSGKTDTVLVLKQPPIFAGAQIVVTEFKTAAKEFNLSFENLRPDAKQLIDNNLQGLRTALADKGYTQAVHIITTTTYIEHTVPGQQLAQSDRERGEQQQRQRQQEQEPEEET